VAMYVSEASQMVKRTSYAPCFRLLYNSKKQ